MHKNGDQTYLCDHQTSSLLQNYKQYTITLRGKVQEVGFRGYLEDLCKRLRVPSIVYNTAVDELKLLCEADKDTLTELSAQIKEYRLGEIRDLTIDEGLELPYPPYRAVLGIEQEIYNRLDEGVKTLYSIKDDTKLLQSIKDDTKLLQSIKDDTKLLQSIKDDTKKLDKLDEISKILRKMSEKP